MQMQMHPQMQGGFGGAYYQQQILAHMQSWQQQQQQMTQMAMMGYPQTQMHPQQPAPVRQGVQRNLRVCLDGCHASALDACGRRWC